MEDVKGILAESTAYDKSASLEAARDKALSENEKKRKARLIKLGAMLTMMVIVLVFVTIAWFSMNREVETSGMGVKSQGMPFEITSIVEKNSNGLWYEPYHEKIISETVSNALVWQMTDESNFGNYKYENDEEKIGGIKPGSYGKISFNVIPRVSPLDLEFDFDVIGYHSSDSVFNEEPTSGKDNLTMNKFENGNEIASYLNGHILLFENREDVYETKESTDEETGETKTEKIITGYKYSGLISSNEDMTRVLKGSSKTHFTEDNNAKQVDIFWIWPNTLSSLVDVRRNGNITVVPICEGEDLNKVQNYVIAHPEWFLKGYTDSNNGDLEDEEDGNESTSNLTLDEIINNYEKYGDMYDMADNSIGMNVSYVLLRLNAVQASLETD